MVKQNQIAAAGEKREVHLLDYWRIVWRGRWTVAAIFVVVLTLVTIGTFLQTPLYEAWVAVEIQAQGRKVLPYQDVSPVGVNNWGWFGEQRYFNTQYEVIKSRDLAERVVKKLDLANHPRFRGATDLAGRLAAMIEVEPVEETGIVSIGLTGPDPREVTLWTNTVAEAYVERNLENAMEGTMEALEQLGKAIEPMLEGVRESEKRRFEFVEQANTYVPGNQKEQLEARIAQLERDLTQAQVDRLGLEAVFRKIEEVEKAGGSYLVIPKVAADPQVQQLGQKQSELERERNKLLVQYLPKHSRVVEKETEIAKVEGDLQAKIEQIVTEAKTQYALLAQKEKDLRGSVDALKTEGIEVTRKTSDYEVLASRSTQLKDVYKLITARQQEITLNQTLISNNIRVLDWAVEPRAPVRPRKALNLATGALLGLLMGVGTVFFLDYMDNTVKTTEDVEQYLKLHLLAVIPRFREEDSRPVKEAYQTLRTSMLFSRRDRDHNAVLITSAGPREGKTSTVVNLGKTLASAGDRVVIVDADLRRPAVHEQLGLERTAGLTNYILSTDGDDWRGYVKIAGLPTLQAITCGPIPPNPPELFGTERFLNLIQELRKNFQWVLIDSPPVVSLTDSVILSSLVDMVAFVIRHSENDRELIRRCITNVRNVNPHVVGAVLNDVDLARSSYRDYYYAGYYYYGADEEKQRRRKKVPATA